MVGCVIIAPGHCEADRSIGATLDMPEGILKTDENGCESMQREHIVLSIDVNLHSIDKSFKNSKKFSSISSKSFSSIISSSIISSSSSIWMGIHGGT